METWPFEQESLSSLKCNLYNFKLEKAEKFAESETKKVKYETEDLDVELPDVTEEETIEKSIKSEPAE